MFTSSTANNCERFAVEAVGQTDTLRQDETRHVPGSHRAAFETCGFAPALTEAAQPMAGCNATPTSAVRPTTSLPGPIAAST